MISAERRRRVWPIALGGALAIGGAAVVGLGAFDTRAGETRPAPGPLAEPRHAARPSLGEPGAPGYHEPGARHAHPHDLEAALPRPPDEARRAGPPLETARRFGQRWANRGGSRAAQRRLRRRLVALSTRTWAAEVNAALAAGRDGAAIEGGVVNVRRVGRFDGVLEVLVTTREREALGDEPAPYRYALYLARLERAGGGYAVSDWESQPR